MKEGPIADAGNAVRNRDARQAPARPEGDSPDAGDAIRNRDARQATAVPKGFLPNAGDRVALNGVRNDQFASG